MKTTRGLIGYWACLILGIAGVALQLIKYGKNELEFSIGELVFTVVAAVFMFAPKLLTKAFGAAVDQRIGNQRQSSIGGGGIKNPPKP